MRMIYLDNAATTKVNKKVLESMMPYFSEIYCNPSAAYSFATKGRIAIEEARNYAAKLIGASDMEIYFTSGGSESDNWAIKAVAESFSDKGKHIITTKIEHHAVLHTCEYLERHGFDITYLNVDSDGKVRLDELKKSIREDTILISVMTANNEIGTIQPVAEIGKIAHEKGILFHTDAVQAYGHIPINVDEMNIDLLSASGHKFNGPKGVGIMYIRKGVKIRSFIHGGSQERGRRAGTYNVPGIAGLGTAAKLAMENMAKRAEKEKELRDYFIDRISAEIPYTVLNGHREDRLPNNINFCFRFVEGESVLIMLDQAGICASSGSACTSGAIDPSHVLRAIGLSDEMAHESLRLTLSYENTKEEIDTVVGELKRIVERLRGMSPAYKAFLGGEKE
ncbi:cysteine desulfurase NifS [Lachnospira hominis (ex Liu et al. 2021)]|uniref:Cysteine desulfurase IscS n=1 Tax=Lachnospira hominis (ex Liu et al. 2021) TaxID=2763051 RepID=A0ABR7FXN8_9FIRM|nr:cysteine desulfurase NifS [Lachnospira hominis]MBC5679959.1 cysteine desulfurase NifS [Lachnospira hominis]